MNPEAFEQLLSEWLDEPDREDLRAAIEAEVARSPELAILRGQYQRMNDLVRAAMPLPRIEFDRLTAHIGNAVDAVVDESAAGNGLEPVLRQLPAIEGRVDWERLRGRIGQSVAAADQRPRVIRFPWRSGVATTLAAAAAIAAFVFWPRPGSINEETKGVAIVRVVTPDGTGAGLAQVSIAPPESQPRESFVDEPMVAAAEVVMVIDPPRHGGRSPMGVN